MQKPFLRRSIANRFAAKADATAYLEGVIGDGLGNVETGTPNKIYCKIGDQVVEAWGLNTAHIYGLSVHLVRSRHYPGDLEIESGNARSNALANAYFANVADHAKSHGLFGNDPIHVQLRQFLPLWLGPTGDDGTPYTIRIGRGIVWTGTAWVEIPSQTIDLTLHLPTGDLSGNRYCRYVLIAIDTTGAVVVTDGAQVAEADFGLDDIPAMPVGTIVVLGAVRLYTDQVRIAEARDRVDLIDLRYPYRHTHTGNEVGGHDALTVTDGTTVDLALTGQQLTAEVIQAALDPANMGSGAAADGQVLTANGGGGAAWVTPGAGGLHANSHQNGGADEINVAGLSGKLADAQTPAAHTHDETDLPAAITVRAVRSTQLDINTAAWTTIPFQAATWDNRPSGLTAQWINTSPSRLTCRMAGYYFIEAAAHFGSNATGARMLRLLKNGAEIFRSAEEAITGGLLTTVFLPVVYSLAVNDYIEVQAYQSSGGSLGLVVSYEPVPQLMFVRL